MAEYGRGGYERRSLVCYPSYILKRPNPDVSRLKKG